MAQHITKQPNGKYAIFSTIVDHFIAYDATREEVMNHFRQDAIEEADRQTMRGLARAESLGSSRMDNDLGTVASVHGHDEASKARTLLGSSTV